MLEHLIAKFCAPALAGIKPANIVSCAKDKNPDIHKELDRLNRELNNKDIFFEVLCECKKRVLLIVYRKTLLSEYLKKPEISKLLKSFGYEKSDLEYALEKLKLQISGDDFPHEIGAFLGYPAHDIYGFINNNDCLLCGEWKVYDDIQSAKCLFKRYSACRKGLSKRLGKGNTLNEIFVA